MTTCFDDLMNDIAYASSVPAEAMEALKPHAPALLETLRPLVGVLSDGAWLSRAEEQRLLYGLHVLACAQYGPAWGLWFDLLRAPDAFIREDLFGDGAPFAVTRITLGLAVGQGEAFEPAALAPLIVDPLIESEVRWSLFEVLARFMAEGRFPRDDFVALLDDVASWPQGDGGNAWAVEHAIALAGIEERRDLLLELYQTPAFRNFHEADKAHALEQLNEAAAAGSDLAHFDEAGVKAFTDAAEALHWVTAIIASHDPEPGADFKLDWRAVSMLEQIFQRADTLPETMRFEEFDGFIHALVIGPDLILPSEYLSVVWGDGPVFEGVEEAQAAMGSMQMHWNRIAALRSEDGAFSPHIERHQGIEPGVLWAKGFLKGVAMRAQVWAEMEDDEEPALAFAAIASLAEDGALDKIDRSLALYELPENLKVVSDFWLSQEPKPSRLKGLRPQSPGWPIERSEPLRVEKIGRNEPCPCGSGKKWKKCCRVGPVGPLQ